MKELKTKTLESYLEAFHEFPTCIKCLYNDWSFRYRSVMGGYIEATCRKCKHTMYMKTADKDTGKRGKARKTPSKQ